MVTAPSNTTSTHTLRLRSDASGMVKGLNAVDRELADVVRQLDRAQAASGSAATGIEKVGRQTNKFKGATRGARAGAQNFAFQLQDIAIQAEQGVDPIRIFVQQGSQILGIFGPLISLLGAGAAALALVYKGLRDLKQGAADLTDEAEALKTATESVVSAQELLNDAVATGTTGYGVYLDALIRVREEQEKQAREALKAATGIQTYVTNLMAAQSVAAQIGGDGPQANFLGLDSVEELIFLQTRLNRLIDAEADKRLEVFDAVAMELQLRGAYNGEIEKLLVNLLTQLGYEEAIRKEVDKNAEAIDDMVEAYEDVTVASEGLIDINEALDQIYDRQLEKQVAMIGAIQEQGRQMIANIRQNPDYLDPRGEGRGAGDSNYVPPTWTLPGVTMPPNPSGRTPSRGGSGSRGKSPIELEKERLEKLNEEFNKSLKLTMDFGNTMQTAFAEVGASALDTFIDGLIAGELNFKEFARSIMADLAKIMLRALIVNALLSAVGLGGGNVDVSSLTGIQKIVAQIAGLNVSTNAKGGIVNSPSFVGMQGNSLALAGEAGPEAIMPLQRNSDGNLGVAGPSITINNYSGEQVDVVRSDNQTIEIAVGRARKAVEADYVRSMSTGQGSYARALEGSYSSRRKVV